MLAFHGLQAVTKEKMLASLERDKALSEVQIDKLQFMFWHTILCIMFLLYTMSCRWPTFSPLCCRHSRWMELTTSHTPLCQIRKRNLQTRYNDEISVPVQYFNWCHYFCSLRMCFRVSLATPIGAALSYQCVGTWPGREAFSQAPLSRHTTMPSTALAYTPPRRC